jgi:hypothetical protein
MQAARDGNGHFHIHTLAAGPDGLRLLAPEKVDIGGERAEA